jgi:hypothetical protein
MFDPLQPILIFLITAGVKEFFEKVLHQAVPSLTSALIATLVGALILSADQLAPLIPSTWLPVAQAIVQLVVLVASAFGIHAAVKSFTSR